MLKEIFISLLSKYSRDEEYAFTLWNEIEKKHSGKKRYYHTLTHLEHIYNQLLTVKDQIQDWDMALFALFYHDFIYNILKQNNEEQSAKKAVTILSALDIDKERIHLCHEMIIATKGHQVSKHNDINLFTDADLSILGSDWKGYKTYFEHVRKEYNYYPDLLYNPGRIKILRHFLNMSRIFKTDHFYDAYEEKAKLNLQQEIDILSK